MKTFRNFEIFGDGSPPTRTKKNDSPCQCDQFCPKIVEIGAILADFRLFEFFRKFSLPWTAKHMNKNMKQLNPRLHIAVSILFFARNGTRDNFFELFRKAFEVFALADFSSTAQFSFQILADSAAIRLVQKSSKSEPSARFFSHLKFRKSLPVSVLHQFPRWIQNRNGHITEVDTLHRSKLCSMIGILYLEI